MVLIYLFAFMIRMTLNCELLEEAYFWKKISYTDGKIFYLDAAVATQVYLFSKPILKGILLLLLFNNVDFKSKPIN